MISVAARDIARPDEVPSTASRAGPERRLNLGFLGIVTVLSMLAYVRGLGFYSDDWAFLGNLATSADHSLFGLARAVALHSTSVSQRPLQALYIAVLYHAFGLNPVGYQIVNCIVLLLSVAMLYVILEQLGAPQPITLAVPLIFAMLPSYSTDRFWMAANEAPLSLLLYLVSLSSGLQAIRVARSRVRSSTWAAGSIACLILSLLAYEVTTGLCVLSLVLFAQRVRGRPRVLPDVLLLAGSVLAFLAVLVFKVEVSRRLGVHGSYLGHLLAVARGALRQNFGAYGVGFPVTLLWIARHALNVRLALIAASVGAVTFSYLLRMPSASAIETLRGRDSARLALAGAAVFALAYAVFATTDSVTFGSADLSNRIAIGAALGASSLYCACGALVAGLFPRRFRRLAWSSLLALLTACCVLTVGALGSYWDSSWSQQRAILARIEARFPRVTPGTLVLNGVCPQNGPAPVFASHWDLAGALRVAYRDGRVRATVVTPGLGISRNGITIRTYQTTSFYPYSSRLLVFDAPEDSLVPLTSAVAARRYFRSRGENASCSPGFAWGVNQ